MVSITWTGLAQCQRCQKTAEVRVVEAIPEAGAGNRRSMLISFDKPDGWPTLHYCSRRCQIQALLTEILAEKERLEHELGEEEGATHG